MTEPLVLPEPWVSYGRRTTQLAQAHPDRVAVVFAAQRGEERLVTWQELDEKSTRMAHLLADRGVDHESTVVVGLPNSVEHYFASYGAWKLGACVLPLRHDLPEWERNRLLDIAGATVIVADWSDLDPAAGVVVASKEIDALGDWPDEPLPDVVPAAARAIASGGSTGRPKIIRTPYPGAGIPPGQPGTPVTSVLGWEPGQVRLIPGPLYHMSPFVMSFTGLFEDMTLVTMERFQADQAIDLIERHRVQHALVVPTMLYRMARVPGVERRDFSSVVSIMSGGAKLAPWVWRKWIELLGPERIWEAYGATEAHGNTMIRGDEWLEHPGSVGKPVDTDLRILDENLQELPPGVVGEIFMRPHGAEGPTFEYIGGAREKRTPDGFAGVGDLGWVDEDGYLFVADRRVDMIISGGANIYPAEVEACLSEHPDVADVAVIGLPDPDWGQKVHALVQPRAPEAAPSEAELRAFCRSRLARYKVPKSFEFVDILPRNDVGKLQRSALVAERARSET
ncbi:MAG TPA: AMP-binding protein [Acidimicrobiales bacterium]|nr:AMP-binding protein [Acidimicrobiales bacterium]